MSDSEVGCSFVSLTFCGRLGFCALVLWLTKTGYKTDWLDELRDKAGAPLVNLPTAAQLEGNSPEIVIGAAASARNVPTRCWTLSAATIPANTNREAPRTWYSPGDSSTAVRASYWIAPARGQRRDRAVGKLCDCGRRSAVGPAARAVTRGKAVDRE